MLKLCLNKRYADYVLQRLALNTLLEVCRRKIAEEACKCNQSRRAALQNPAHTVCRAYAAALVPAVVEKEGSMQHHPSSAVSEEGWPCAGSVLPIWQPLFDVLARSSSSSLTIDGKKAWPHFAMAHCLRIMQQGCWSKTCNW